MESGQVATIPKYERVKRRLLEEIQSGRRPPGAPFPSERELLQQFRVSRPTLVRSLQELVRDGYLVRQRGKGTFVAPTPQPTASIAARQDFVVFLSREVAGFTGAERMVQLRILRGIQLALGDAYDVSRIRQAASGAVDAETRRYVEALPPAAALVIEPSFCPPLLPFLREHGCAVWAVNEPDPRFNAVRIDHDQAGYLATQYLLSQGRERIALLNGPEAAYWGFAARRAGYERALREANVSFDPRLVLEHDHPVDSEAGRAMVRTLLEHAIPFDGVVGASDSKTIGAVAGAREAGIRVPEQVAFVSIDNTLASHADPPLPAVAMPFEEMGYQAAMQARMTRHNGLPSLETTQVEIVLRPTLVER